MEQRGQLHGLLQQPMPSHHSAVSARAGREKPHEAVAFLGKFHSPDNSLLSFCSSPFKVEVQC